MASKVRAGGIGPEGRSNRRQGCKLGGLLKAQVGRHESLQAKAEEGMLERKGISEM